MEHLSHEKTVRLRDTESDTILRPKYSSFYLKLVRTTISLAMYSVFCVSYLNAQDRDWLLQRDSLFKMYESDHFKIYYYDGLLSTAELDELVNSREIAFDSISRFFRTDPGLTVNLHLFPSGKIKYEVTGHQGPGWAFENNIAEVYNDSVRVDPYHELVHIIGYEISRSPALIDEGLAVYLSHRFADLPFSAFLGFPGKSINEILRIKAKEDGLLAISLLYFIDEISAAGNGPLAYCESASFVEYIISTYGEDRFLKLFSGFSHTDRSAYEALFSKVYNKNLVEVEQEWLRWVGLN